MSRHTKKARKIERNAIADSVPGKVSQSRPEKDFKDNRSVNLKHISIQQRVDSRLNDVSQLENSGRLYPVMGKSINFGADNVAQLGKYNANEFIGSKNSPTHVHIYNKERGHVKVGGVVYKYGYSNSEEQNMRDAKKALQTLNEDDVTDYGKIMSFINDILAQYE